MLDLTSIVILVLIGAIAIFGLLLASGVRPQQFVRPLAIILIGALLGDIILVTAIILARLPLAMADYQEGAIAANEVFSTALFYFSWFPILTPAFFIFGLLGAIATGSIYTIIFSWRHILE